MFLALVGVCFEKRLLASVASQVKFKIENGFE